MTLGLSYTGEGILTFFMYSWELNLDGLTLGVVGRTSPTGTSPRLTSESGCTRFISSTLSPGDSISSVRGGPVLGVTGDGGRDGLGVSVGGEVGTGFVRVWKGR